MGKQLNSHMDIKRSPTENAVSMAGTTRGSWMDREETIAGLVDMKVSCWETSRPRAGRSGFLTLGSFFLAWVFGFFFFWVPRLLTLTEP